MVVGSSFKRPRKCQDLVASPGANWRLCWDLSGAMLIGWDTVMIPFTLAFVPGDNAFFVFMNWVTMLFWTFDMVFTFFVGYVAKNGRTVMNPRLIAKRYFTSWFGLDILVVTGDWFNNVGEAMNTGSGGSIGGIGKMVR